MEKKKVAVIFGGSSSEHEVSQWSAASILEHIPREKYEVACVGITRMGDGSAMTAQWPGSRTAVGKTTLPAAWRSSLPDRGAQGLYVLRTARRRWRRSTLCSPVLHGKNGEDGTIQGLLQLSGIPYVGCGPLASAVCMDKAVTRTLLVAANIDQTRYLWFYADRYIGNPEPAAVIRRKIEARLEFLIFVKPANAGSSVGISKVEAMEALDAAVEKAAREDSKIVVEEGVAGQEVECAVLGNRDAEASPVGEIGASAAFYDYDDKYKNGTSQLFIPARIGEETTEEIRRTAVRAYRLLGAGAGAGGFLCPPEGREGPVKRDQYPARLYTDQHVPEALGSRRPDGGRPDRPADRACVCARIIRAAPFAFYEREALCGFLPEECGAGTGGRPACLERGAPGRWEKRRKAVRWETVCMRRSGLCGLSDGRPPTGAAKAGNTGRKRLWFGPEELTGGR